MNDQLLVELFDILENLKEKQIVISSNIMKIIKYYYLKDYQSAIDCLKELDNLLLHLDEISLSKYVDNTLIPEANKHNLILMRAKVISSITSIIESINLLLNDEIYTRALDDIAYVCTIGGVKLTDDARDLINGFERVQINIIPDVSSDNIHDKIKLAMGMMNSKRKIFILTDSDITHITDMLESD